MTSNHFIPTADLCEYLYANHYDIEAILPECAVLETMTALTSNSDTQALLRGLTGHDHFIDAQHIPKNQLDQLCCTDVTRGWTSTYMNEVETVLLERGWLHQRRSYPCDISADPDAVLTVSVSGDQDLGTILFIRDYHWPQSPDDQQVVGDEVKMMVFTYRLKELRTLLQLQAKHVFVENTFESWTVEQVRRQRKQLDDNGTLEGLREALFSGSLNGPPTAEQMRVLSVGPIQLLYALVASGDVALYGTTSSDGQARNEAMVAKSRRHEVSEEELTQYNAVVEAEAVERVMHVIRAHPGERSALIFGASHQFRDDFVALPYSPTMLTLHFEALGKNIMSHPNILKL